MSFTTPTILPMRARDERWKVGADLAHVQLLLAAILSRCLGGSTPTKSKRRIARLLDVRLAFDTTEGDDNTLGV